MNFTRSFRKKLTYSSLRLGQRLAQKGDCGGVERLRKILKAFTQIAVPLRRQLERNMKLTGVYQPELIDAYFDRAADQLIMMAHGFRADFDLSFLLKSFRFEDSFGHLEQAYAKGKGVMVVAGHLCGYPSVVTVISTRLPCAVYSRRNKDSRKVAIMEAIAKAEEVEVIYRPESSNRDEKLQPVIDVLRQGKMLFITPDTPRKQHEGVAVSILGKTAYFPAGAFVMSMRTGSPVVPVWWRWEQDCCKIHFSEPIELSRGGGRIRDKAEEGMKQWSCQLDTFIRAYPEMWWNWLDKRWTHIIRNHNNLK